MTNAELERLAREIVQAVRDAGTRRRPDAQGPGGPAAQRPRALETQRPRRPGAQRPSGPAAQGASVRPLEDISWRGPQVMLGAWTPAVGPRRVADFVDHTLLKAEATRTEILKLCAEAREHVFAAVCVNPAWVDVCARELVGSRVAVAAVCGFPLGATTPASKAAEATEAVGRGASEVDMVAALGHIKGAEWSYVEDDIAAVVEASRGALVKVIIESAVLSPAEIVKASAIAKESGAHFVKTSTGFHPAGGATREAVRLMRLAVGDDLGVKAAGGVRDCATALAMIEAGASRIGTSSGVAFVDCLGPGPLSLADLLAHPESHVSACKLGSCAAPGPEAPY